MAGLDTHKANPRKRPPRPDTSPLVEMYRAWENRTISAFESHWRRQAQELIEKLNAIKAATDINSDTEFWKLWAGSYIQLTLPLLETAVDIGTAKGAALLELTWALGVDADLYNVAAAEWASRYAAELAKGLTQTDRLLIRRNLAAWIETGDPFPKLVERITNILVNPSRARRIAVTESTRAFAEGNLIAWRKSEVVTGKTWETANDELVCPFCGPLHGQLSELDGQEWQHLRKPEISIGLSVKAPPAHPNCRCWLAPWVGEIPA